MEKVLYFYDVDLIENSQLNFLNSDNLKSQIADFCLYKNDNEMSFRKDNFVIDIESIDESHIFGSYGKLHDLNNEKLTRGRDKETDEKIDFKDVKEMIERYTFFYFDVNTNKCVTLYNSKCKGFDRFFRLFLLHHFRCSTIYKDIKVTQTISDDIDERLGKAKQIKTISYTYSSDNMPDNDFLTLSEIARITESNIRTASVQLYMKPDSNPKQVSKTISVMKNNINSYDKLKVETEQETIDLINKIVGKKIIIKIHDEDLHNHTRVLSILRDSLEKNCQ